MEPEEVMLKNSFLLGDWSMYPKLNNYCQKLQSYMIVPHPCCSIVEIIYYQFHTIDNEAK